MLLILAQIFLYFICSDYVFCYILVVLCQFVVVVVVVVVGGGGGCCACGAAASAVLFSLIKKIC